MTLCQVGGLGSFQWRTRLIHGCFPLRLDVGKLLLAEVTCVAPGFGKPVQLAGMGLPIGACLAGLRPSQHLLNQRHALGFVCGRFGLQFAQPLFHQFVGLVAGLVKSFPQCVVGSTAMVSLFPAFTQATQHLLHLAATQALPFRGSGERLGLGNQLLAQLVGTPALPAFHVTGLCQQGLCRHFNL